MSSVWLQALTDLIQARTGLSLREHDGRRLQDAVRALLAQRGGGQMQDYVQALERRDIGTDPEWHKLLELLTVGETYFFRDEGQMALLREQILPELIRQRDEQRCLRIWSAACAGGEEAYSLAILVHQLLETRGDAAAWDVRILGTDIHQSALKKARAGRYGAWSFRRVAEPLRQGYFSSQGEEWKIHPRIAALVDFQYGNLVEDNFPSMTLPAQHFDLIVCRNVFIYFDATTVARISEKLAACLRPSGYLMTGHGELGITPSAALAVKPLGDCVLYQNQLAKPTQGLRTQTRVLPGLWTAPWSAPAAPGSGAKQHADIGLRLGQCAAPASAARSATPSMSAPRVAMPAPVDGALDFPALLDQARSLADQGKYAEASALCQKAATMNLDSAHPHLILAQIAQIQGAAQKSKEALKRAIYLDTDCLTAYVELANIYLQEGNRRMARKMLDTSVALMRRLPAQAPVVLYHPTTSTDVLTYLEQHRDLME